MKYVDEFRDPEKARFLLEEIRVLVPQIRNQRSGSSPIYIMEVCGGHTHAIFRYGVETMLPDGIELIHGPGCPVCVLPMGRVDDCVALAHMPGMIFTTFGDAMRVPGSKESLLQAKANGADVRMVYSPLDSLRIAKENPDRQVVFFALGFETTMPSTAFTVLRAKKEGIENFCALLQSHHDHSHDQGDTRLARPASWTGSLVQATSAWLSAIPRTVSSPNITKSRW